MAASISSFVVRELVRELSFLQSARLEKIFQVGPELFRFVFSTKTGKQSIIIEVGKRFNLSRREYASPAKPSQVALILRKHLEGKVLRQLLQHGLDRIIVLDFGDRKIVAEFFSHGNLILIDADNKVLFSFREEEWKDRKISRGIEYSFPKNIEGKELKENYLPFSQKPAGSVSDAVDEFFFSPPKNLKLEKLKRRLESQLKAMTGFERQAREEKEKGDLVYKNYALVERSTGKKTEKITLDLQ